MEKYSVLMSLYIKEDPEYLKIALDSMLGQTVKPDEIVIVEDGSLTDALYSVLDSYGNRITRVVNNKNLGLGLALNRGLKVCRNEFVARMDTDDIAVQNRCELQLRYLEKNPNVSIVGGQIEEFMSGSQRFVGKRVVPIENNQIYDYMKKRCPFNHMTVMFKKNDVINVGGYMDLFWNEDYYLWIRMAMEKYRMANLKDTLVNVRIGNDMYRRRGGIKYFKSECFLQKLLLSEKMISSPRCFINIVLRFILQLCIPSGARGIMFRTFARKRV